MMTSPADPRMQFSGSGVNDSDNDGVINRMQVDSFFSHHSGYNQHQLHGGGMASMDTSFDPANLLLGGGSGIADANTTPILQYLQHAPSFEGSADLPFVSGSSMTAMLTPTNPQNNHHITTISIVSPTTSLPSATGLQHRSLCTSPLSIADDTLAPRLTPNGPSGVDNQCNPGDGYDDILGTVFNGGDGSSSRNGTEEDGDGVLSDPSLPTYFHFH